MLNNKYPSLDRAMLVLPLDYQVLALEESNAVVRKQRHALRIQLPKIVKNVTESDRVSPLALTSELPICL